MILPHEVRFSRMVSSKGVLPQRSLAYARVGGFDLKAVLTSVTRRSSYGVNGTATQWRLLITAAFLETDHHGVVYVPFGEVRGGLAYAYAAI